MTKGMNDFCFLHQTGIFECITKDENGNLVIDPKLAEVVRRIYREYLEGYSMKSIALHLEQDGILTGAGNTKWYDSTINKILRNEKYMGDALLQKTATTDFLTKKRVYSGNNCFSQIIVCGECGDLYRRVHWYIHGKTAIVWRFISRLDPSSIRRGKHPGKAR